MSLKSSTKLFSLTQIDFLIQCLRQGSYNLITYDEQERPVIATNFYIDGDVLHKLFESDGGELRIESQLQLVEAHMTTVENNLMAMDIFATQIQAIITLIVGAITFIKTYIDYGWEASLISTASVGTIIYLLKKKLARFVFWAIKEILRHYLTRVKKEALE